MQQFLQIQDQATLMHHHQVQVPATLTILHQIQDLPILKSLLHLQISMTPMVLLLMQSQFQGVQILPLMTFTLHHHHQILKALPKTQQLGPMEPHKVQYLETHQV